MMGRVADVHRRTWTPFALAAALTAMVVACTSITVEHHVTPASHDAGTDRESEAPLAADDGGSAPSPPAKPAPSAAPGTPSAPGAPCTPLGGCASSGAQRYLCDDRTAAARCVPTGELGDFCIKPSDCPNASSCSQSRCFGGLGAICSSAADCASGTCNGLCVGKLRDSCTVGAECLSGICIYAECRADYGDPCTDSLDCRPKSLNQVGPQATGLCVRCGAEGVDCQSAGHQAECLGSCAGGGFAAGCR
jgi:hypothetical protein